MATVAVPLGAPSPLSFTARFGMDGYQVGIRGGAALPRLRELARVAGVPHASALDRLEAPPATLDLRANGPWLRAPATSPVSAADLSPQSALISAASDHVNGALTLRGATWKPDFLASPVEIPNATMRFDETGAAWDPVAFSYGPVKGTATLRLATGCTAAEPCPPQFTAEFASLDAAELQAALFGARESGTLFSSLLARLRPGTTPAWPEINGTARAVSLVLGPVILKDAAATLHILSDRAEIESLDTGLLGGRVHAHGSIVPAEKPDYKLEGQFEQVNPAELGRLLGMTWTGKGIDGTGTVEMAGFTDTDLGASAKGSLHFDWRHGAITENGDSDTPAALSRFDRWTADADIADGAITLKQNQVLNGARKLAVAGSATFGDPPRVTFGEPQEIRAAAGKQAKP